jgi:HD-like signal output (HDOD) protein
VTRQRILFVDDDANILEGLRNFLRKDRLRWDMVFAASGASALAECASGAFDVIVCDMRMPVMDGATLLQQVKRDYPETTRIVLSGQAEHEGTLRALAIAHQFLSKPCDGDVLRGVIERTCALRALLVNDTVKQIIGRVHRLPSEPGIYWELMKAASRPNVSTKEVAAIVEREPAMTAKVLQLVNSAYFGLARRVTSIQDAITYLGLDLVKALTLTAQVFKSPDGAAIRGLSLTALQKHSLLTARLAGAFASSPKQREEAFTAAMVHEIGQVVLALGFPDRFPEVAQTRRDPQPPQYLIERELFEVTHAEVGAYLLGSWGLPFTIVEAVAFHHEPGLASTGDSELLTVVHVAAALAHRHAKDPVDAQPDMAFLESVGLAARLPEWEAIARKQFDALAEQERS